MTSFRAGQIAALVASGWAACPSVVAGVRTAGLPDVTRAYLEEAFGERAWARAEAAVAGLAERFANARFADEVRWGLLLVPDPARLDTRRPMDPAVRADQLGAASADAFDPRLPEGRLTVAPGRPWTMVATVVGAYGPALGSYRDVTDAPAWRYLVQGLDSRTAMTRQLWGARALQAGSDLPDCEHNEHWTFTVLCGEPLTDGVAESGTVLKGKVRFRLGKPDRGIGSARVAPAIAVAA